MVLSGTLENWLYARGSVRQGNQKPVVAKTRARSEIDFMDAASGGLKSPGTAKNG
jgi:hypothetical protein